jgi:hypothetical protein
MDGTKDTAAKETAWLSMGPCPERPVWKTPTTDFTPHMAALISHHEKDKRYQDSNASKAMVMLQSYCTPRLNEFCSKGVYDVEDVPPREKLLHLWSWIKQLQIADRTVIGQVKDDMRNLLPITTFQEAISNIAAMDLLQSELTTMGEPYSDENLISLHSSKLANTDSFKALKKQFLLSEHHLRLASPPNVRKALLPTNPSRPGHTWESYCIEVEAWHRLETPAVSSLMPSGNEPSSAITVNSAMEAQPPLTAESVLTQVLTLLKTTLSPPKPMNPYG